VPPIFLPKHSVFISYARKTSAEAARALHAALGNEAFFDQEDIEAGDRFPERLVDALLGCRVVVVFPDEVYFEQLYCRWELKAALEPFNRRTSVGPDPVSHLIVVLPEGDRPSELDKFPAAIQMTSWSSAKDTKRVVKLVRKQLARSQLTLGARYAALGQPLVDARARLLELTANRSPESLAGIRKFPSQLPTSKGERFVGRANDLWRIDFALGTLRGNATAAALIGSIEGAGGVGKTQLALEYVHRFGRSRFPDGIFWVDGEEDLEAQHHGILRTLDPAIPDLLTFRKEQRIAHAELSVALDKAAAGKDILFVVDNIPESSTDSLSKWCPALNKVTVLATSRAQISAIESAVPVPVGVLGQEAAAQLLTTGLNFPFPPVEADQVAEWVGRLPLALTVLNAALRLKGTSIEKLAEKARHPTGQTEVVEEHLNALRDRMSEGALRGVIEAFAVSYDLLSPDAQRAARLLARLAPSVIPTAVIDALELSPAVRMALTGWSFITDDESTAAPSIGVFGSMHRVLADYVQRRSHHAEEDWERVRAALTGLLERLEAAPGEWRVMQMCVPHVQHVLQVRPSSLGRRDQAFAQTALQLCNGLGFLSRPEEAIVFGQAAVEVYRKLAQENPESFLPGLAISLANLANRLGEMGRRTEGLKMEEEAVKLYRSLVNENKGLYLPQLAATLSNLSVDLGEMGRGEEGLRAAEEAVEAYRALVKEKPKAFLQYLATSLTNLSARLGKLGRLQEGLKAAEEAIEVYRGLVKERPEAFLQDLATSLNNLSILLGEMERNDEGLRAAEEAVEIRRQLASERPEAFLQDLATSLNNLAIRLAEADRLNEGLKAIEESVAIRRSLAEARPRVFSRLLARSLLLLSMLLNALGRADESQRAAEEVADIEARLEQWQTV